MYKLLIITLLTTLINAQNNPKVYAALGDVIYDNVNKIQKLETLEVYKNQKDEIIKYISNVEQAKEQGNDIELKKTTITKKEYLTKLRELSKINDYFNRSVKLNYKSSIKNENSDVFSQMINSGLIDTNKHKQEILTYYFAHAEDINASGVIQSYLDDDAMLKAKNEAKKKRYKSKKEREQEKIKRIRENDKIARQKIEEALQAELVEKKKEIRKVQREELSN